MNKEKALMLIDALENALIEANKKLKLNANEMLSALISFFATSTIQIDNLVKERKISEEQRKTYLDDIANAVKKMVGESLKTEKWEKIKNG